MKNAKSLYAGHRFPADVIRHAVWLYYRFRLSRRDVEDLLAERGITVSHETIHQWCRKFGGEFARRLRTRRGRLGDAWFVDEVFVKIQGTQKYLWRAVVQDGDVIDILVTSHRDRAAAERFFKKLLKHQGCEPRLLVTDKLASYGAARRSMMPSVRHDTRRYANNLAEASHLPTRHREHQMRRFKSVGGAQRFLAVHGAVQNLFRVGRHLLSAAHYRQLREQSFLVWRQETFV